MKKEILLLYQIKGDVDRAMRELHPELLQTEKNDTRKKEVQEER